jgi:hypothetical protein
MWCNIVEAEIYATDQSAQGNRSWSGFYYDGTVYTDAEEEEMIRKQFNIPKSA